MAHGCQTTKSAAHSSLAKILIIENGIDLVNAIEYYDTDPRIVSSPSPKERSPVLSPVKSASLRTLVSDSIREAILSGKLPPGTPLRAFLLARDLGVSQATVREALLQLEHKGLLTNEPGVGIVVTKLTGRQLRERRGAANSCSKVSPRSKRRAV
jgi:hypothetical protein